jgi:surface antigen
MFIFKNPGVAKLRSAGIMAAATLALAGFTGTAAAQPAVDSGASATLTQRGMEPGVSDPSSDFGDSSSDFTDTSSSDTSSDWSWSDSWTDSGDGTDPMADGSETYDPSQVDDTSGQFDDTQGTDTGGEQVDPNAGDQMDPNAGDQVDPNAGDQADPNAGDQMDPNAGDQVDPNAGDQVDPNAGDQADPNAGGAADPNAGGAADPAADPNAGGAADPNAGGAADPAADPNAGGAADPTPQWYEDALANDQTTGQCTAYVLSQRPDLARAIDAQAAKDWTASGQQGPAPDMLISSDAGKWRDVALKSGRPVDKTPEVGAVMVVQPNVRQDNLDEPGGFDHAGSVGHVAVVDSVNRDANGNPTSFVVSEMNAKGGVGVKTTRTIPVTGGVVDGVDFVH